MTTVLNQIAEKWFSWELSMFWQVGVLIIIVAGLDLLIKKWAWPQVRYALWLLVLVKLVLPPSLTSPTSFTAEIPFLAKEAAIKISQPQTTPQIIETVKKPIEPISAEETIQPVEIVPTAPAAPATVSLSWKVHTFFVWLAGVIILSGWLIIRLRSLRRQHLKDQSRLPERLEDLLASTARKLGLKKVPQIILTNKVCCPAIFGVFQPVLLMPADKLQNLTAQDAENIFLHELAHIKRGDLFVHAVYMILQIAYWFNPLLWLIRKQLQNLRELCCDATVARLLREKTVGYRQTLLETARQLLAQPVDPGLGLLGLFENSSWLVDRLQWLEKKSWKFRLLRIATIFVLVCLMATCVLPMTKFEAPPGFTIKGTVTDAQTGKPIAGAKVGDVERYAKGKQYTTTDANGNYSYKSWYEEHATKCSKEGYKTKIVGFNTRLFGKEKEKVINFALVPEKSSLEATVSIKQIMKLAEEKARSLNHEYIGTEHILLVIAEEKGAASDILRNGGIDKDKLFAEIMKVIKIGLKPVTKKRLSITPRAKQAVDYAVQQAGGEKNLNTGHILVGLMQVEDGVAAQVLKNFGLEKEKVINFTLEPKNRTVEQAGSVPHSIATERGQVNVVQLPSKENDYELIVNFNDDKWGGPSWYNVTINVIPIKTKQVEKLSIRVRAYIDGISNLVFKKNSVYWHNLKWAVPGRHGGNDYPTYINDVEWIPQWPAAKAPIELRGEQKSEAFRNLPFSLPRQPANVQIEVEKPAVQIRTGEQVSPSTSLRTGSGTEEAIPLDKATDPAQIKNIMVTLSGTFNASQIAIDSPGGGTAPAAKIMEEGLPQFEKFELAVGGTNISDSVHLIIEQIRQIIKADKDGDSARVAALIAASGDSWNELKNIVISDNLNKRSILLKPNLKTDVQIEVEKPAGQVNGETHNPITIAVNVISGMVAEMQPSITEIQKEAVKLKQLKEQNAPESEIEASEKRIEELSEKIDAIGDKWGEKMNSIGEQLGKNIETWVKEYDWQQFSEKMAEWGRQFGEQMQRQFEQTSGKTSENSQKSDGQSETTGKTNKASESSAAQKNVKIARTLKITVYEGNDVEPQTSVNIPLVAMKIVHQLLPPKEKLQMIAQKMKLDESMPQGMDCNTLIDTLDEILKQVDQGIEATTLLEVKDGTDHVVIALE